MKNDQSIISKSIIEEFSRFAGKQWEKDNPSHRAAKENFDGFRILLKTASEHAAEQLWGRENFDINVTRTLKMPSPVAGQRGGGQSSFQNYLSVNLGKKSPYSIIIRYWIGISSSDNQAIAIRLGSKDIINLGKKKNFKPSAEFFSKIQEIRKQFGLEKLINVPEELSVLKLAEIIIESVKSFSLTYEQFCDELKPSIDEELKKLNDQMLDTQLAGAEDDDSESPDEYLQNKNTSMISENYDTKNLIFYGPPGTGKTFRLQKLQKKFSDRCRFVTFHQSYGYEEFVEGLRPMLVGDAHSDKNSSDGHDVKYKIEPGSFKRLCDQARRDPTNGYAIFIDEINRGNISKIFGELITLIELDKRSDPNKKQEQQFQVELAYSKESFTVPANVSIFGSMNTADRSLALIDTALRRRFEFKDLYPDTRETKVDNDPFSAPLAGLMVDSIDVRRMLECINERIEVLYDRDHCIGHAYFTGLIKKDESTDSVNEFDQFRDIFFNRIKPLLEEYFFDDWEKIGRVLGDHLKKESRLQFLKKLPLPKDLRISDDNSDDSNIFLRPRYRWNDNAFSDPDAYIGIYSQS